MSVPAGEGAGQSLADFGSALLGERGLDPFLEEILTVWRIHWNLSTDTRNPLLAWDYLLNRWQEPGIVPSAALKALQKEATRHDAVLSLVTIDQDIDTFLHTQPSKGHRTGDSPQITHLGDWEKGF